MNQENNPPVPVIQEPQEKVQYSPGCPHFEGFLVIKTGNPFARRWVKRWFVIDGSCLHCFVDSKSTNAINTIYLREARIFLKEKKKEIELKFNNHRTYQFRAADTGSFAAWSVAFNRGNRWTGETPAEIRRNFSVDSFLETSDSDSGHVEKTSRSRSISTSSRGVSPSFRTPASSNPPASPLLRVKGERDSDASASHMSNSFSDILLDFSNELKDEGNDFTAGGANSNKHMNQAIKARTLIIDQLKNFEEDLKSVDPNVCEKLHRYAEDFKTASQELFVSLSNYAVQSESERSMWHKKYIAESNRRHAFEEALKVLAEDYLVLERKASTCHRNLNDIPDEDEGDEEYFDAMDKRKSIDFNELAPSPSTTETSISSRDRSSSLAVLEGFVRRSRLPADKSLRKISIWGFLKNNIGRDLSKITMPILFNEPLTSNQRFTEDLEYCELLDISSRQASSLQRLVYIAAFAITSYASTVNRIGKPFNPMLGETYELKRVDMGFRMHSEQVSHHPPVVAMHAESLEGNYIWYQDVNAKASFRAKDMLVKQLGSSHVVLPSTKDHFHWAKATTCIHNIIVGKLWLDHIGDIIITNSTTGDICRLKFKPYGFFGGVLGDVEGSVVDAKGTEHFTIDGNWTSSVSFFPSGSPDKKKTIWVKNELPAWSEAQYNMTSFAMTLNELEPHHPAKLPPTDSRFRPDQRLYEEGNIDKAEEIKNALEEKQRSVRKMREAQGESYEPLFFQLETQPDSERTVWISNGKYWDMRGKGDWASWPDLFSLNESASQRRK